MANVLPSLVAHTIAGSSTGTNVTTSGIDTTGATLLVVAIVNATGSATPSDSKSNTWTSLTAQTTTDGSVQMFYVANPTVGASHTFTATVSGSPSIAVVALSGVLTSSPLDVQGGSVWNTGTTSHAIGSVTPSNSGDAVVFAYGANANINSANFSNTGTGTPTVQTDAIALVGAQHYSCLMGWGVQAVAGAFNITAFNFSSTTHGGSAVATFKLQTSSAGASGGAWAFA